MFTTSPRPSGAVPSSPPFQTYILPANPFRRGSRASVSGSSVSRSSFSSVFSRRKSSSFSTTTIDTAHTASSTPSTSFGTPQSPSYLSSAAGAISCSRCHADLALTSQIISKGFTGRHGRAYLLSSVDASPNIIPTPGSTPYKPSRGTSASGNEAETALPNTILHRPVPRHLVTGMHTVSDLSCAICGNVLGWKYVGAEEEAQRYKVGNFILESRRTLMSACWDGAGGVFDDETNDEDFDYGAEGRVGSAHMSSRHNEDETMFDSQDEDECEDLFAGVWTPELAEQRRTRKI